MVPGGFDIEDFSVLISTLPFGLMRIPYFGIVGHFSLNRWNLYSGEAKNPSKKACKGLFSVCLFATNQIVGQ